MYEFKFIDFGRDLYFLHDVSVFVWIKVRAPLHPFLNTCLKNWGPLADALFMVRGCDVPVTKFISERLSFLTQWQCRSLEFRIHCRLVDQYWLVSHFLYVCVVKLRFGSRIVHFYLFIYFIFEISTAVLVRLHQTVGIRGSTLILTLYLGSARIGSS
jgi:hypothetical protein